MIFGISVCLVYTGNNFWNLQQIAPLYCPSGPNIVLHFKMIMLLTGDIKRFVVMAGDHNNVVRECLGIE